MPRGKLIVIDGPDGSGKTTQTEKLVEYFTSRSIPANRLHYPDYSGPIGSVIKGFLDGAYNLSEDMQFLLYAADMIKNKEQIREWLSQGHVVVIDRYFTSTLAYQGAKGFPLEKSLAVARLFDLPQPDIIIYLSVSYATAIKRKKKQKKELDRFEKDREFFEQVDRLSKQLAKKQVFGTWVIVDGERPPDQVFAEIKRLLHADAYKPR